MPETLLWWIEHHPSSTPVVMNPTHLTHPMILSVTTLPSHIKDKISAKFESYIHGNYPKNAKQHLQYIDKYMHSMDTSYLLDKLFEYIQKTDSYREQNFFDVYPQYNDIFDNLKNKSAEQTI